MVAKAPYLCYMQVDTNWYCNQNPQHHFNTVPTCTVLHLQLKVNSITDFHAIPKIVCNITHAKKSISRQPICLTDSYYDCILEEIGRRENFSFKDMRKFIVLTSKINMIISD